MVTGESPGRDAAAIDVIDAFEREWGRGRPAVAEFVERHPQRPRWLLVELVAIDLENRLKRGEAARVEEYVDTFPMLGEDPSTLRDLLGVEHHFRRRTEPELRLEDCLQRFPSCVGAAPSLHSQSLGFPFGGAAAATVPGLPIGTEIGGVTIVRVIAEGGMGRVYEGRQHRPARPVAVKVMRPGIASGQLLRRFELESELLGRLRHPGIAQIFSAGTHVPGGAAVPYFVMELVADPRTIVQYADEHRLSTRDRLDLFRRVCEAVAHGHQRGVIHRDLKPGNILVDSSGQPKVIDFGVARATDSDLALTSMRTDVGQLVGTLQYMSPEQFDPDPGELDIRADVYALGVVLYELLAGRPPYDLRRKPVFEAARVVREEEPPRLPAVNGTLPRDVGLIAATCLQKNRGRRYSSAAELAADIGRHLAGEPIAARPAGFIDGVGRLARRHKVATATAAGILVTTAIAAVVSSLYAVEAFRQRGIAEVQAARAESQAEVAEERTREAETQRMRSDLIAYASALRLTEAAFKLENTLSTTEHLDSCRWDLRGWEYRALWRQLSGRRVMLGHEGPLRGVAVAPDGSRVASAGEDGTVRIWNASSGEPVAVIDLGRTPRCLAWHPGSRRLVIGCDDGSVEIRDTAAGQAVAAVGEAEGPATTVAFRKDGGQVLVCRPAAVTLHDADTGERQGRHAGGDESFAQAAYSPDGGRVVTIGSPAGQPRLGPEGLQKDGGPRSTIRIWDAAAGEQILAIPDLSGEPTTIAWCPDGRRIVASTFNHHRKFFGRSVEACELKSWDAETGRPLVTFTGHHEPVLAVAVSCDGTRIASANGGFDNSIRVWDSQTGRELRQCKGIRAAINAVAFSPDGSRLFTGSEDSEVRVWDVAFSGQPRQFQVPDRDLRVNSVSYSPDGRLLATGDGFPQRDDTPGIIRVWETATGRPAATLEGHSTLVRAAVFSPDGAAIASIGSDVTLRLWDWRAGRETASFSGDYACLAYASDGRSLAAGGVGVLDLRDAATGEVLRRVESPGRSCRGVAFHRGGEMLAAAWDADLVIHDARSGAETATLKGHAQTIWSLAWSPDGQSIATAAGGIQQTSSPGEWKVWDVARGRERIGALVPGGAFRAVAWTPDGGRVITGGFDMKIRSWDAVHGLPLHAFPTSSLVFSMAMSPDGTTVACGTHSAKLLLFEAVPIEDCRVLRAPMAAVAEAWFTADGRLVVARDEQGETRAWSMATGEGVRPDPAALEAAGPKPVTSPDGAWTLRTFRNTVVLRPAAR